VYWDTQTADCQKAAKNKNKKGQLQLKDYKAKMFRPRMG
jgi:hypothetical protein